MDYFIDQSINGLSLGCMYGLIALGYTMVYGVLRLINFAHGEIFMVGSFAGFLCASQWQLVDLGFTGPFAFFLAVAAPIVVGAVSSGLVAVVSQALVYRPVRGEARLASFLAGGFAILFVSFAWSLLAQYSLALAAAGLILGMGAILWAVPLCMSPVPSRPTGDPMSPLLAALGLSLILQHGTAWAFTANHRPWPDPRMAISADLVDSWQSAPADVYSFDGDSKRFIVRQGEPITGDILERIALPRERLYIDAPLSESWKQGLVIATLLLAGTSVHLVVKYTRIGKAMRALSRDPETARLMGISPDRVIAFAFLLGGLLAGLGGVLWGMRYGRVEPFMGFLVGLKAFVAAVLGGIGSIPGAIVGGIVLGYVETIVASYGFSAYRDAVALIVLIAILLVRPAGLFGAHEGEKL